MQFFLWATEMLHGEELCEDRDKDRILNDLLCFQQTQDLKLLKEFET